MVNSLITALLICLIILSWIIISTLAYFFYKLKMQNTEISYLTELNELQRKPIEQMNQFITAMNIGNTTTSTNNSTKSTLSNTTNYIQ